jgi:hypothetical protein
LFGSQNFLHFPGNVKRAFGKTFNDRFKKFVDLISSLTEMSTISNCLPQNTIMIGKAALLEAIAGKNRGILATDSQRQAVLAAIAQLEDRNPTPRPIEALDLLDGDWRLIYTTSRGILGIDQFPFLTLGQVYQCIRAPEAKLYNIAEVVGLPFLEGIISVAARFKPVSERRVDVTFERSLIGFQPISLSNSKQGENLQRSISISKIGINKAGLISLISMMISELDEATRAAYLC